MPTIAVVTIERVSCGVCSLQFGLEQDYLARMQRTHAEFHCPNGHEIHYGYETAAERRARVAEADAKAAKAALEALRAQKDRELATERAARECAVRRATLADRRRRAQKGIATKLRKRAQNGVCPVQGCRRHFQNLQQHIATKHPAWMPDHDHDHDHDGEADA